eukprot:gnl/Spiro4/29498_TR14447_c0_g1_i1.p1 gnl/Spiro4/29498_TR14447_c0_g1~~gnl/Spiro4/29498_TR14447_c0_g1_i1.p1  ORF type:complete len:360 (-),score=105.24 gnl/Spiro4/29498_TR14447_c0_g1_i1:191-1270(-)
MANTAGARFAAELAATAQAIASPGRGILAADESTNTIGLRFEAIKCANNEDNRRAYRELLFTTPGLGQYISGVILYDETARQSTADGRRFIDVIKEQNIVCGIKVDTGVVTIPGTNGESSTSGLDNLAKRCTEYYAMGCRFAKWRAVYKIADGCPSDLAIQENSWGLARYAAICQSCGLVPIVEPEILMDGPHSLATAAAVTERVLHATFKALADNKIFFEGMLLKPNMVLKGYSNPDPCTHADVARATVTVLRRTVPAAVPGITFLSGGQSEEEASLNLNAMNQLDIVHPWKLTFSYGRALQASTIEVWNCNPANVQAAQQVLLERARANSEAQFGRYGGGVTGAAGSRTLFVAGYVY